jgi:hypothetical protein
MITEKKLCKKNETPAAISAAGAIYLICHPIIVGNLEKMDV